ncbi:MAG: D-alanine--D-alanine ligase [Candidatus Omnitrophica bacterium]|nr:D-alanine--D-alanine ligase [Candidatus Omnitrophota bacterium]
MGLDLPSKPKLSLSKSHRIGVFCGGTSSERVISKRSGHAVIQALKRSGYCVSELDPAKPAQVSRLVNSIDIAFLTLHGAGGEDGTIQEWLEKRGKPYVGSGANSSRLAYDKIKTKRILIQRRIPTAPFIILQRGSRWQEALKKFGCPCFIKPPREGSSIGILSVSILSPSTLKKIKARLQVYGELMAERTLEGAEYTVGILGQKALPVVELRPKSLFYDFKAKYTSGMTDYIVPAEISVSFARKLQNIATRTHKALGLRDLSRIDLKVDRAGNPFVLEANSIPGFTEFSLLPKAAKACGLSFEALCCRLVSLAIRRKPLTSHRVKKVKTK